MKKLFRILFFIFFFSFKGNWDGIAQAQPQIYHKIIAWKGTPVKIIKTFDDNVVLLWLKDTTVKYGDTLFPFRQVLYLTKVNTKDTSIIWNNRVMLEDYKRGAIGYNLMETKNRNIMIFGGYYDSTSVSRFGAIKYNSDGALLSFITKPLENNLSFKGVFTAVNPSEDEIIFTDGFYPMSGANHLIYYNENVQIVKIIDSMSSSLSDKYFHFVLPYSLFEHSSSYIKGTNGGMVLYDVGNDFVTQAIKRIDITTTKSRLNNVVLMVFTNPINNENILLTQDSLFLTNYDLTFIRRFPLSDYLEKGYQSQTITDIKYLSDGSIMFGGIITAVLNYAPYLTKINGHGVKQYWQAWDEASYYNAGFVEDTDGGIISFVARTNDGSAYPNLMWIEKRNPDGLLENWTPAEIVKHSVAIKLMPNPAHDYTVVDLSESFTGNIIVYNLIGQVMLQQSVTQECDIYLNTQNFEKGLYFIKLNGDNQFTNAAKLIIQ